MFLELKKIYFIKLRKFLEIFKEILQNIFDLDKTVDSENDTYIGMYVSLISTILYKKRMMILCRRKIIYLINCNAVCVKL